MALELHIPDCIMNPAHSLHPPPLEKPLRISIEGPLVSVEKLLQGLKWRLEHPVWEPTRFQSAAERLARLTYRVLYNQDGKGDDMIGSADVVVRDEYLGWVQPLSAGHKIDYYGVTFDHRVPVGDDDPDVLQINIIETEEDQGEYANKYLPFRIDAGDYTGKRVLAVPRCCQLRVGSQDRNRVNYSVLDREGRMPKSSTLSA
ncbi:hypothetical protein HRG_012043 [Hirsutella rhossiliensis]